MNITQEPKHTSSTPTILNHSTPKKLTPISAVLMAALLTLLSSPSPGMAASSKPSKPGHGPAAVDLGSAGSFVILSKSGITDVYPSAIVGNVGTSPITGAALLLACDEVVGTIYTVNAAGPACRVTAASLLTRAVSDMQTAYTDAAGRKKPNATELGSGNINGMTILPGLYKWSSSVLIPSVVTLSGGPNDVWIFQIAGDLIESNGAQIILQGGAQAKNIFWQVAGETTLGTTANFKGVVLCKTLIAMQTGAAMSGRALAQTAVTLEQNAVTQP
jgi:Ice-binding-like